MNMHSLAMHADSRPAKGLGSPKISGRTSPSAIPHHHPHHAHLVMPHAAHPLHAHHVLHHQHSNPYSLSTSLSLTPTTESTTSSPTSSSHVHNSSSLNNSAPNKYDLPSNHHQGTAQQGNNAPSAGHSTNSHSSSSHHSQNQPQQHHQHEYGQFGAAAGGALAANVKSETPGASNYDYMSQCYFGGGSVPVSSAAPPAFSSSSAIPSTHGTTGELGYHHQHNVIQVAKLMASS